MKKRRYFISYGFVDIYGVSRFDNCTITTDEKKIIIKEIEEGLIAKTDSTSVKILYFRELENYEILE